MEAIIVPCTKEKVWDADPIIGPVAAKDAYLGEEKKRVFPRWKAHAEQSGARWFILSTEYGLIEPDKLITKYNKTVSAACGDQSFKDNLRRQGAEFGLGNFDKVILLDWEKFKPLVKVAIGDGKAQYELRKICY